jgi:hypothetical protein
MMKRHKKERLKSGILLLLMFLSMIQTGILWNQTQGLPFSFLLEAIFAGNGNDHVDVERIKDNYFYPENIVVFANSFNQWILTDEDLSYQIIWDDIRQNYLPEILKTKSKRIYPADMWSGLKDMSSVRIDFAAKYPNSMLLWFSGMTTGNPSFNGIKSMIILPQENVNVTVNTLLVYDESNVYMYHIEIKENMRPKAYYSGLSADLRNQTEIMPMSAIGETFPDFVDSAHDDIPIYVMDPDVSQSMRTIDAGIPESLILDPESDDLLTIQESILLEQRDSFLAMRDKTENIVVFSDLENVYQLNSYGVLEYKYLPAEQKTDLIDAKSSFIHALSFIELRKSLVGDADIMLKDIKQEGHTFVFTFGYRAAGLDIYISDVENNNYLSAPAIRIKASAERVLECTWVVREFNTNLDSRDYSMSFIDMLDKIYASNPTLLKLEKFQSIRTGYHLFVTDGSGEKLRPCWLVRTDQAAYRIPIGEKEN